MTRRAAEDCNCHTIAVNHSADLRNTGTDRHQCHWHSSPETLRGEGEGEVGVVCLVFADLNFDQVYNI